MKEAVLQAPAEPPRAPAIVGEADTTPGTQASRPWAVRMRGVGKQYRLGQLKSLNENIREDVVNWLRARVRSGGRRAKYETFWALRDIDLDVERGDTIGIIGRNGAGKSTLLKILSRITQPTTGELRFRGRLASLLEVGTGFHRELTGRENIYLNGAILGMTRPEINAAFDAIVDFAGVEKFLDTPVKRYSSGMYVRLAFAVAAHLRTDILVVDEVLAVGDAEFQKKCLGKMQDVAHDGRTVFFVSHNMGAVGGLCRRGVLLERGSVSFHGAAQSVILQYMNSFGRQGGSCIPGVYDFSGRRNSYGKRNIVTRVETLDSHGHPTSTVVMGEELRLRIHTEHLHEYSNPGVGVVFNKGSLDRFANFNTFMAPPKGSPPCGTGVIYDMVIPEVPFTPGVYALDISVAENSKVRLDYIEKEVSVEVLSADIYGTGLLREPQSAVYLKGYWEFAEDMRGRN